LLNDKGYAQLQADYNAKDKEVKKLCKGYKTRWIESKLQETKTAAAMQLKVTQRHCTESLENYRGNQEGRWHLSGS